MRVHCSVILWYCQGCWKNPLLRYLLTTKKCTSYSVSLGYTNRMKAAVCELRRNVACPQWHSGHHRLSIGLCPAVLKLGSLTYVYIYTCTYMSIYVYTHTRVHTFARVCAVTCTHIRVYLSIYLSICLSIYLSILPCMRPHDGFVFMSKEREKGSASERSTASIPSSTQYLPPTLVLHCRKLKGYHHCAGAAVVQALR